MEAQGEKTQRLGFDSCGIFYIGGSVKVTMPWGVSNIEVLTAVAGDQEGLDIYEGEGALPGQPWHCYRSGTKANNKKCLQDRLRDLLEPSTTREELDAIPFRKDSHYCPYLRLKQKQMDRAEWLVADGSTQTVHNGAHFPLCVFTHNASARSETRVRERAENSRLRKGKGAKGSGKYGRWRTAVADATYYGKPVNAGKGTRPQSAFADHEFFGGGGATSSGSGQWPNNPEPPELK
jgi:hypothetical protein